MRKKLTCKMRINTWTTSTSHGYSTEVETVKDFMKIIKELMASEENFSINCTCTGCCVPDLTKKYACVGCYNCGTCSVMEEPEPNYVDYICPCCGKKMIENHT